MKVSRVEGIRAPERPEWRGARRRDYKEASLSPFARVRAAVDVQYFTRRECGVGQKQRCVNDFFDLSDPAHGVQLFEKVVSFGSMHRSIDRSRRNDVYANAVLRIFNGEGARHRIQGALQHDL